MLCGWAPRTCRRAGLRGSAGNLGKAEIGSTPEECSPRPGVVERWAGLESAQRAVSARTNANLVLETASEW